ncbi:MAG: phosphate ABC transporter substrate-binding protein [Deltaproteobacteria bacterium]|nr:phosphate ABC transporter substrate-binding protein [Deltaproteobacteria bacterium]
MTKGRRRHWVWPIAFFTLLAFITGCQKPQGGLSVVGSTSVQPFAEILVEEYMGHHGQEKIYIQGGGSSAGIQAVRTEAAQIGMSSRLLMPDEQDLIAVPIAYDAIAVIVHPRNPPNDLTKDQIKGIFSGRVTHWSEVGGRHHPITLVTREEGSGTREAFQHLLMGKTEISLRALVQDSNGAIRQVVADDPNAIGYISLGLVNDRVKAVKIDGVEASVENIKKLRYKIVRPFLFVFKANPQGMARNFLDYVLSPAGQKLLVQEGLVSTTAIPHL